MRSSRTKWAVAALVGISMVYLLQVSSPLRLEHDVIVYLSVGASAADGHGFLYRGTPSKYPIGYPALIAGLDALDAGASWAFIALNLLCVGAGLTAAYFLVRRHLNFSHFEAILLSSLVLLSYVLVKYVTLPKTEVPFLAATLPAAYTLLVSERCRGVKRWTALIISVFLVVGALSIRAAGVALIPAVIWAFFAPYVSGLSWSDLRRNRPAILGITVIVVLSVITVTTTDYLTNVIFSYSSELLGVYTDYGTFDVILWNTASKLTEWGELLVNAPSAKLPAFTYPLLPCIGGIGLGVMLYGIWRRRHRFAAPEVLVLTYASLLLVWPGHNARFWLPILPLLAAYLISAVKDLLARNMLRKELVAAYLIWFAFAGTLGLAYSTRISLTDRSEFAEVYGDSKLDPAYHAVYDESNATAISDTAETLQQAVFLLKRYGGRER